MDKLNRNFEEQFQDAFEGAEITPSEQVWNKVDASLTSGDSGKFRKRLLVLQLMTAASLALAIGVGGVNIFWDRSNPTESQVAQQPSTRNDEERLPDQSQLPKESNSESIASTETETDEKADLLETQSQNAGNETEENANTLAADMEDNAIDRLANINEEEADSDNSAAIQDAADSEVLADRAVARMPLMSIASNIDWLPDANITTLSPGIYSIPVLPEIEEEEEENNGLWAGLGMSANSFDPNFGPSNGLQSEAQLNSGPGDINTSRADNDLRQDPAFSYAMGFSVGKQVSRKWILQGGLQYSVQNADASSTVIAANAASGLRAPLFFYNANFDENTQALSSPEPIDLNNTFEFISFPVEVGYVLINGRFSWAINTGLSTRFLLKNTISDDQGSFDAIEVRPGADAPFRAVHINGLIGTELIYKLGGNYMISIEPNFQHSISALTKPGQSFGSRPRSLGLGVRLKYIFD